MQEIEHELNQLLISTERRQQKSMYKTSEKSSEIELRGKNRCTKMIKNFAKNKIKKPRQKSQNNSNASRGLVPCEKRIKNDRK